MNCDEFLGLIFDYIDGNLDENSKKSFEQHMNECESCKKEYEAYNIMIKDLNNLPDEELPTGYCKKLHLKLKEEQKNNIKKKRNNLFKYVGIAACFVMIFSAVYMLDIVSNDKFSTDIAMESINGMKSDASASRDDIKFDANNAPKDMASSAKPEISANNKMDIAYNKSKVSPQSAKIIKSGSMNVETENFDDFIEKLENTINENLGYFEKREISVRAKTLEKTFKYANIKLRVPQDSFDNVLEQIEGIAIVNSSSVDETDVTKEYYDKENIVLNLEAQESKLRDLYDRAQNVTEILELENELRRVRTEIDAYRMDLSEIDDRVFMSTIELDVNEVASAGFNMIGGKSLTQRSKDGFVNTINGIIELFENIIVVFVSILPIILPIGAVALVVVIIIKKNKKNKNK